MTEPTGDDAAPSAWPWTTKLGWRVQRRPAPGFAHALGGGAGAFALAAIVALVVWIDPTDVQGPGAALTAVLVVTAMVVGHRVPGPVRSACVTTAALGVVVFWAFLLLADPVGEGDIRGFLLLTLATHLVLFTLVHPTRGRAVLLGLALLVAWSWLTFEADSSQGINPYADDIAERVDPKAFEELNIATGDNTEVSVVSLLLGTSYLAVAAAADRRKLVGLGTPFIVVGAIATIAGAAALGADDSAVLGGFLAALAGLLVGLVGTFGKRRASTWIGALTAVIGIAAVIGDVADSTGGAFGLLTVATAVFLIVALWCFYGLDEATDGDDEPTLEGSGSTGPG